MFWRQTVDMGQQILKYKGRGVKICFGAKLLIQVSGSLNIKGEELRYILAPNCWSGSADPKL
jgi:hypothetical protein